MALVASGGSAGVAYAAPQWLGSTDRGTADSTQAPDIAMNSYGDVAVAWVSNAGVVQATVRPAGGEFAPATSLSAPGAANARVAIDPFGTAIVVWQYPTSSPTALVQAAVRPAGQSFLPGESVSSVGVDAREPQIAMDGSGNAIVVWRRADTIIEASTRPAGGSFSSPPVAVSSLGPPSPEQATQGPQVAMDAAGNAVVVWTNSQPRVRTAMRPAGGPFQPAVNVASGSLGLSGAQVAMSPGGEALAVWQMGQNAGNNAVVSASSFGLAPFGSPVQASPNELQALSGARVGLSQAGEAVAVYQRLISGQFFVQSAIRSAGAWGPRGDLPNVGPLTQAPRPDIAMNAAGADVAAWQGTSGVNTVIQAAARGAGGAFGAPEFVSLAGADAKLPQVAIDGDGDGVATWIRAGAAQVAGYDAAGPKLEGLSAPSTAQQGSQAAWFVSPKDVWSGINSTVWSFGDGAQASGPSATHAYAAAGTYTVTVTSTDTLGNSTSAARPITITPKPPEVFDTDGDGSTDDKDCAPNDPTRHPGATDKPGNKVDENCDGHDEPYKLLGSKPELPYDFPEGLHVVHLRGINVRPAIAGSTVRISCSGGRRACVRYTTKTRRVTKNAGVRSFRSLLPHGNLRPGARFEVRVTKSGLIGRVVRLTVFAHKLATRVDLCLTPGTKNPRACPRS